MNREIDWFYFHSFIIIVLIIIIIITIFEYICDMTFEARIRISPVATVVIDTTTTY